MRPSPGSEASGKPPTMHSVVLGKVGLAAFRARFLRLAAWGLAPRLINGSPPTVPFGYLD